MRNNNEEYAEPPTKTSSNWWWAVSLMMLTIVVLLALLFTTKFENESKIMTFLTFTATILSIVLSIIAVMYSFYSMQDASRKWNNVDKAVSNIKEYTDNINQANRQLIEQVISINRNLGSMQGSNNLNNEIPKDSFSSSTQQKVTNTQRFRTETTSRRSTVSKIRPGFGVARNSQNSPNGGH